MKVQIVDNNTYIDLGNIPRICCETHLILKNIFKDFTYFDTVALFFDKEYVYTMVSTLNKTRTGLYSSRIYLCKETGLPIAHSNTDILYPQQLSNRELYSIITSRSNWEYSYKIDNLEELISLSEV